MCMCMNMMYMYILHIRRGHKFETTVVNRRDLEGREKYVKMYKYSTYL